MTLHELFGAENSLAGNRNVHGGGGSNIVFGVPPRPQNDISAGQRLDFIQEYVESRRARADSVRSAGYSKEMYLAPITTFDWSQPLSIWEDRLKADIAAREAGKLARAELQLRLVERYLANANPMDLTHLLVDE